MSGHICASFFGGFEVRRNGELVSGFGYDKVKALLAYLSIEPPVPLERSLLAGLLWPDQPEEKARHSLRQALSQLRSVIREQALDAPLLLADRTSIQRNPEANFETDVEKFDSLLHPSGRDPVEEIACLATAMDLYRGELLEGLSLAQTIAFEEWCRNLREHYQRMAVEALEKLVHAFLRQSDYETAKIFSEKWVKLEPWREEAYRTSMLILARLGKRSLALKQYERCRRILSSEFDIEPEAQTERLHQRIRAMGRSMSKLPYPTTPFIGRKEELQVLKRFFAHPDSRLINILGPGGIGKTRLAVECGRLASLEGSRLFINGVFLIPLESVSEPERLLAAIAQGLSYTFVEGADTQDQLLHHLKDKELLLILDNFEQIIGDASRNFLISLIKEAEDVKVVLTSRQRINFNSEVVLPLEGLQVPNLSEASTATSPDELKLFSAAEFFLSTLDRVRGSLSLTQKDILAVARICQLVEGMPLALELAASWWPFLSLDEITLEITRSLDFLQAEFHDQPARHRSIRAMVDTSWRLLAEAEKTAFTQLSVFQGGFNRRAAEAVVGASARTLSRLVGQSLLKYDPASERFHIHELLRQYGQEKLNADPHEVEKIGERHVEYYANFLHEQMPYWMSSGEQITRSTIEVELKNVIAAWKWALERGWLGFLSQMAAAIYHFYVQSNRFHEGAALLQLVNGTIIPEDGEGRLVLAWIFAYHGDLQARGGDWELGRKLLHDGLKLSEVSNSEAGEVHALQAFVLNRLGTITLGVEDAEGFFLKSLELSLKLDDRRHIALVQSNLGELWKNLGKLDKARSALEGSLAIQRKLGLANEATRTLSRLGLLAVRNGDLLESARLTQDAVALAEQHGDQDMLAGCLEDQGINHMISGRFLQAESCLEQSLEIRLQLNQEVQIGTCEGYLGFATCHQGKFKDALGHARRALMISNSTGNLPIRANSLLSMGMVSVAKESFLESRGYLQESIASYSTGWQHDWRSRRAIALAILACAESHLDDLVQARVNLNQAMKLVLDGVSYASLLQTLSFLALLFVKEGRSQKAVDVYELARMQPLVANSIWLKTVVGRHIGQAKDSSSSDSAVDADGRGHTTDLWHAGNELLAELQ
ncbi:MAG TPA: BTAD domain-containing putative transcriptional regulator [Anaerolineales bacterium]